jgi:hypothetical protein
MAKTVISLLRRHPESKLPSIGTPAHALDKTLVTSNAMTACERE